MSVDMVHVVYIVNSIPYIDVHAYHVVSLTNVTNYHGTGDFMRSRVGLVAVIA